MAGVTCVAKLVAAFILAATVRKINDWYWQNSLQN